MTVLDSKPTKSVGHFEEKQVFRWQLPIFVGTLSKVDQNLHPRLSVFFTVKLVYIELRYYYQ
jgi:hypothetical protein